MAHDKNDFSKGIPRIIQSHLPENAFGSGVCFKPRSPGAAVDTLIVHACHVPPSIALAKMPTLSAGDNREEQALSLRREWIASLDQKTEYAAIKCLIDGRRGTAGLEPYSVDGIKDIFEFYGVSAHYIIDRDGQIFELVDPDMLAFHAGKSKLPSDNREGVNAFSVGIELLATEQSGYEKAQLAALTKLTDSLMTRYPIQSIYGHSDIAPERKPDPWLFNWAEYLQSLKAMPAHHP